jgi:hypothetical protein
MSEEKRTAGNPTWIKSGKSPNPSGKSKTAWLTNALKLELTQDPGRARRIAVKILDMAEAGELEAAKIVFDRTEGRPSQTIDVNQTITEIAPSERQARILELQAKLVKARVLAEDVEEVPMIGAPSAEH